MLEFRMSCTAELPSLRVGWKSLAEHMEGVGEIAVCHVCRFESLFLLPLG